MYGSFQLFLIFAGLFFAALVFSLLINSLFMRFARTLGIRGQLPLPERWSSTHKPALGGIGFYIVFLACFAFHGILFPGQRDTLRPDLLGLLAATSLAFLMGLADDAYNTRPLLKLGVQVACGGILVLSGSTIDLFEPHWANVALTLLWVVGLMNAVNMLDNMDGITSVVSIGILSTSAMVILAHGPGDRMYLTLIVGAVASLAGFLFFNWNPSRMYMGDTGSQFLGVLLAYLGIRLFWNNTAMAGPWVAERQVFTAVVPFLLPIADTTTVFVNRILRGRSPFVGGRDHSTHHLSYAGLSDAQVAMVFGGLSLANLVLTFVLFRYITEWRNIHTVVCVSYVLAVQGAMFLVTHRYRSPA